MQCVTPDRAARKAAQGWNGYVLNCEGMPDFRTFRLLEPPCTSAPCVLQWRQCAGNNITDVPGAVSLQCCERGMSCVVKVCELQWTRRLRCTLAQVAHARLQMCQMMIMSINAWKH